MLTLFCLLLAAHLIYLYAKHVKCSRGDSIDRYYLFKLFGCGAFLHRIHDSEPHYVYHTHPWNGISIIFGSYMESHADHPWCDNPSTGCGVTIEYRRRFFSYVSATRFHRVRLYRNPVWTLFLHGPSYNKWATLDRNTGKVVYGAWEGEAGHKSYVAALAAADAPADDWAEQEAAAGRGIDAARVAALDAAHAEGADG